VCMCVCVCRGHPRAVHWLQIINAQQRGEIPKEHPLLNMPAEYLSSEPADLRDSLFAHLDDKHPADSLAVSAELYLIRECRLSDDVITAIRRNLSHRADASGSDPIISLSCI
jgi:hypothetical protein